MEYFTNRKLKSYPLHLTPRQLELLAQILSGDQATWDMSPAAATERMEVRRKVRVMWKGVKEREERG